MEENKFNVKIKGPENRVEYDVVILPWNFTLLLSPQILEIEIYNP